MEKYLKYKDLTTEQVNELYKTTLSMSNDLKNLFSTNISNKYYYRYLCCNSYEPFKMIFQAKLNECLTEMANAFALEQNYSPHDFIDTPINFTESTTGTATSNSESNSNDKVTNSGSDSTTGSNSQNSSSDVKDVDTSTYKESSIRTDNLKQSTNNSTVEDKTGTDTTEMSSTRTPNLTSTASSTSIDNTVTETDTTQGQMGVKQTTSTPAATFTTKTITSSVDTPNSTTGTVKVGASGVKSDVATNTTAGGMAYDSLTNVTEAVSFTSLDRDSDLDYKQNVTIETWGQDKPEGGVQPLETTTSSKVSVGRAEGSQYNQETSSNTTQSGNEKNDGETTVTYDTQNTSNFTGSIDNTGTQQNEVTMEHNDSLESGKYKNVITSGETEGNSNSTTNYGHVVDTTGSNTSNATSNTQSDTTLSGYNSTNRILMANEVYKFYVDNPPFLEVFTERMNICFAAVYEGLDDRQWFE